MKINLLLGFAVVLLALAAIRENQLQPHLVKTGIAPNHLTERLLTDPAYVSFQFESKVTSNGLEYVAVPVTNYYWKVWSIFRP